MNTNRPKNLDISTIELPVSAKASILHRISGFALFFAVAFMLCALDASLESEQSFADLMSVMDHWLAKLITWGILSLVIYHLFAGIKHLIMDAGFAETKEGGPLAAKITLVLTAVVIVLMGIWVW